MQVDWTLGLAVMLTAALAAFGGLLLLFAFPGRPSGRTSSIFADKGGETVLMFDGETLIDSTPEGRTLLAGSSIRGGPWLRLLSTLAPHFPDLEAQLARLPQEGEITLMSQAPGRRPLLLEAEARGGLTRIVLIDPDQDQPPQGRDPASHRALLDELEQLRTTVSHAPVMIWRERANGDVVWANGAYLLRAAARLPAGQDLCWPLPRIFDRIASAQGAAGQRQKVEMPGGAANWFDLVGFAEGEGRLLFALPADAAVQAEGALRDFMQTLTKTFAHLPIGLAIFDHQRQLQLFNPALLDLTGLPPDFLSLRPSLLSVLDAMRDRSMIPEPKDYRSWRREIVEMERAAASGLYEETWSLPGGQTYRVIGRPHPNGALALMIEDISSETRRTRRYRADLELGQSVIDEMDEAIAVISQSGQLVMSNAAYAGLWGHDPSHSLGDAGIRSLCAHWRRLSAPNPIWADAEDFVVTLGERRPWRAEARLSDGRLLSCRFAPLAGAATLASFRLAPQGEATQPRLADDQSRRSA